MLANVKARGSVACGVTPGLAGPDGNRCERQLDRARADYCRGLAAVVFNDPTKVSFVPLAQADQLGALTSGKVDALGVLLPWTLNSDTEQGIIFAGTMFYDGQGFLAPKTAALRTSRDLAGKAVCVEAGAQDEADLREYFDANNITAIVMPIAGRDAALAAYSAGTCLAFSADISVLAGVRSSLPAPGNHVLLPDFIAKKPLGVAIAQGDDRWFDIARWTFFALLDAEELGVTQGNVDETLGSDNISTRRLLGVEGDFGAEIGLGKDWAYQLIKNVGNYADIYDRNVGDQSPLKPAARAQRAVEQGRHPVRPGGAVMRRLGALLAVVGGAAARRAGAGSGIDARHGAVARKTHFAARPTRCPALHSRMPTASGRALTSISAARSPRRCSAIPTRSISSR